MGTPCFECANKGMPVNTFKQIKMRSYLIRIRENDTQEKIPQFNKHEKSQ